MPRRLVRTFVSGEYRHPVAAVVGTGSRRCLRRVALAAGGTKRNRVIPGQPWGLMERGAESFLHYLEQLPPAFIQFPAGVSEVFSELAADDRQAAMERVPALPENLRPQAYAGIASGWMKQDPVAALEWVRAMAGGGTRDDCLKAVLDSEWALDHPDDAGGLLQLFTKWSGLDSNATVRSIFRSLRDADPVAAGEWAIKYLSSGGYNSLIEAELIPQAVHDAPEMLVSLLTSLTEIAGWIGAAGTR